MVRQHQPDCRIVLGNSVGSSIMDIVFATMPVDVIVLGEGDITMIDVLRAIEADKPFGHMVEPQKVVPGWNGPGFPTMYAGEGIPGIVFKDEQGRVIAALEDYAAVREFVADLVAEGVEETVKPEIREVVEMTARLIAEGGRDLMGLHPPPG